jgi:CubicO group peptidase (beta-lactamase class C family)
MLRHLFPLTALLVSVFIPSASIGQIQPGRLDPDRLRQFEQTIEDLRQRLRTPSFGVALVKDGEIAWAKGLSYADLENQIEATANTPYHLASLTKTFASTIVMRLVEDGLINLDDPITEYGLQIPSEGIIRVRHLLSHTSEDPPGRYYRYNGARFGRLDWIIRAATGEPFGDLLEERIVKRLGLTDTSPSDYAENYDRALSRLAMPYEIDRSGDVELGEYPTYFGTSAGLVSSAADLAKYYTAIDHNVFLSPEVQQLAFTPAVSTAGDTLPYGLGWFTQEYMGVRLIWHYGYWTCNSSLIVKVPEQNLSFIILTNTNALSHGFSLGTGDVLTSPVAIAFLKTFVLADRFARPIPEIDWSAQADALVEQLDEIKDRQLMQLLKKELMAEWSIYNVRGDAETKGRLFGVYSRSFAEGGIRQLSSLREIVRIEEVGNSEDLSEEFSLSEDTEVHVYAVGEIVPGRVYDSGWIEDAGTGETVWQMTEENTEHAGGAVSNRRADLVITLPAGTYRLRYRSDRGHAFGDWQAFPPDDGFWGIAVFEAAP